MNRFSRLVVYVLALAALPGFALPGFARSWHFGNGQTVEGDFVKSVGAQVVLLVDGKPAPIPIKLLSRDDQKYVREQTDAQRKTTNQMEERTWKDANGHTGKARFMGMDGDKVVLLTADGQSRLPFKKFCRDDQNYVRKEMIDRGEGDKVPAAPPVNAHPKPDASQIAQANPQTNPPGTSPKPKPKKPKKPKTTKPPPTPLPSPIEQAAVASTARPPEPAHPDTAHPSAEHPPAEHPAPAQLSQTKVTASPPAQSLLAKTTAEPKRVLHASQSAAPAPPVKSRVCSACGQKLPDTLKAGESCPNCGVYLKYEDTDQGRVHVTSALSTLGALGGLTSLCCVVAVAVFRLRSYAQHS